jgi:hypothetical protein
MINQIPEKLTESINSAEGTIPVLFVDDDEGLLITTKQILEQQNKFQVDTSPSVPHPFTPVECLVRCGVVVGREGICE